MAGAAIFASWVPSSRGAAFREGLPDGRRQRRDAYGNFGYAQRPLVLQSLCGTNMYLRLRDRKIIRQSSVSSQRYLSRTCRSAISPSGLLERIASSQFCNCSTSSPPWSGLGREGLINRQFKGLGYSKCRTIKVAAEFRQVSVVRGNRELNNLWARRRRRQGLCVSQATRGQPPQSEDLDVSGFRVETKVTDRDDENGDESLLNDGKLTELLVQRIEGVGVADGEEDSVDSEESSWMTGFVSKRWGIVIMCFFAFLLCNMDRVNMSIAVLPMAAEYHWTPTIVGLVQSSFFWGYLLTQIAGGIWADSIGGKQVLGFGVIWWSLATILTPIAAKIGLPALFFVRACMGVGEGVAMPAMNNLLSRWIPVQERSRALAFVYSGMYLGSVIGLACSPSLIHRYGWPSVFFSFGSIGAIWFFMWQNNAYSSPSEDPTLSEGERTLILKGNKPKEPITWIPWGLLLSKAPVWALIICHFCHNWGTFILLTWMPTYYNQVLGFNLMESGMFSVLPWLTMAISANVGGWIADGLVSKGYSVTIVRKVMQTVGFLGPAFFLTQLSHITSPHMAVLCMMASQGLDAFSQSGLYSNHQDIGPRYSGILLGLSNTAGVLAGVFGTAATGYILQHGSWDDVFKVAVGLYLFGTVVWNVFSTGEQLFD